MRPCMTKDSCSGSITRARILLFYTKKGKLGFKHTISGISKFSTAIYSDPKVIKNNIIFELSLRTDSKM